MTRGDVRALQVITIEAPAGLSLSSEGRTRVLTKGAPETVRALLRTVPAGYDAAFAYHTLRGKRVIALAGKATAEMEPQELRALPREEAERGLDFLGFLVLHNPMKPESAPVLSALREASHSLVMITGDQVTVETVVTAVAAVAAVTAAAQLLVMTPGDPPPVVTPRDPP